jgi:adenine deaminase
MAKDGKNLFPVYPLKKGKMGKTVKIKAVKEEDFHLPAGNLFRIIRLLPGQIVTGQEIKSLRVEKGQVVNLVEEGLAKIAVIERHQATGRIGLGLLAGLGLRRGALATSVAHDAHNLLVTGVNDTDMVMAVKEVARMGGGLAAVCDGRVVESLSLPVAGLMSEKPVAELAGQLRKLEAAAREFGAAIDSPFMALSFLALSVIPALKITDRGLVDSESFQQVPLVVTEGGD